MIAIDCETYDPNLHDLGDGSIRKDGNIVCIGLYDGKNYVCCEPNDSRLIKWLGSPEEKCFHNSIYDLSWLLLGYDFKIGGIWHDTMTRETLINEYNDLDLDSCCKRHKIEGKSSGVLEVWYSDFKKLIGLRGSLWQNINDVWLYPEGREQIIKYNKQDCIATYNLFMKQEPYLKGLEEAYQLECSIVPILLEMKKNGIAVDVVELDRFTAEIEKKYVEQCEELTLEYGITDTVLASPKKMTVVMNELGIHSPIKTSTGAESWSADALILIDNPVIDKITEAKRSQALLTKYLRTSLRKALVNDRIHTTFYATKRDTGGTVTGRLAAVHPNLQQIPAREEKHGKEMRSLFIANEGMVLAACDYSQIEAVLLANYAQGQQAEWFKNQFKAGIDFHTVAITATDIKNRDQVKTMNYGIIYGMGANKMFLKNKKSFGTLENTKKILGQYHTNLPVIRDTMKWVENQVLSNGYITSIGGRRHHKPKAVFENGKWNTQLYKCCNHFIQGTAADIMKKAMVDIVKSDILSCGIIPQLTVHDELVFSVPYNKHGAEGLQEINRLMCNAFKDKLELPMKTACEVGHTWGSWRKDIYEEMCAGQFNRNIVTEELVESIIQS